MSDHDRSLGISMEALLALRGAFKSFQRASEDLGCALALFDPHELDDLDRRHPPDRKCRCIKQHRDSKRECK